VGYLEQYGLEEGYLLIFDFRKDKELFEVTQEVDIRIGDKEKRIIEVYC
jgi:hypothetical protein